MIVGPVVSVRKDEELPRQYRQTVSPPLASVVLGKAITPIPAASATQPPLIIQEQENGIPKHRN
jgi:hypothetical protein